MTLDRLVTLWTYRSQKVANILMSYVHWLLLLIRVKISQLIRSDQQFIGVLLAEQFGDLVACEPLSREIKRLHPKSTVYWIVRKQFRELLDHNPNIDVVVAEYSILFSILVSQNNTFDHFYNCQMPDLRRYPYTGQLLDNPLARSLGISTETYHDFGTIMSSFALASGLPIVDTAPIVYITDEARQTVDRLRLPARYVVIHCHSNFAPKDWQVRYWKQLVDDLIDTFSIDVVEIGLKSSLSISRPGYHDCCGKLSLLETSEVIRRASYFVGIDSGPAHVANAVGTFGFLLYGQLGKFTSYMPYTGDYQQYRNVKFITVDGKPCSELPYEAVWPAIQDTIRQRSSDETQPIRLNA